jgi:hypothetical protein
VAKKQSQPPVPVVPEVETRPVERVSKIEAVRRVLATNPNIKPQDGADAVKDRFGIEMGKTHFSSYKTHVRAKMRKDSNEAADLTTGDLKNIREMLRSLADEDWSDLLASDPLAAWLAAFDKIEVLATKFGGFDRLRRGIHELIELQQK